MQPHTSENKMTFKDLKIAIKDIEQDTQTNWDDAIIFFDSSGFRTGRPMAANDQMTLFQNAPIRAIIFKP